MNFTPEELSEPANLVLFDRNGDNKKVVFTSTLHAVRERLFSLATIFSREGWNASFDGEGLGKLYLSVRVSPVLDEWANETYGIGR